MDFYNWNYTLLLKLSVLMRLWMYNTDTDISSPQTISYSFPPSSYLPPTLSFSLPLLPSLFHPHLMQCHSVWRRSQRLVSLVSQQPAADRLSMVQCYPLPGCRMLAGCWMLGWRTHVPLEKVKGRKKREGAKEGRERRCRKKIKDKKFKNQKKRSMSKANANFFLQWHHLALEVPTNKSWIVFLPMKVSWNKSFFFHGFLIKVPKNKSTISHSLGILSLLMSTIRLCIFRYVTSINR